jgi:membrane associated rhomboid family serine protease
MQPARPPVGDPATRALILANVAIFVLQLLAGRMWIPIFEAFSLTRDGLLHGELWQLVTYQFLHANELHIFVNMLGLWFAGRELERVIGTRRFVALYLAGGVVGGLAQAIWSPVPLVGASAAVCAVLLALTTLFPRLQVTALLFFVLPLRMKARTLGIGLVAASVVFWLSGFQRDVGHLAHLGGFATGWTFGLLNRRRFGEGRDPFGSWPLGGDVPPAPSPWRRMHSARHLRPLATMDEILAKVLTHGIESLTPEERRILEESRQRRRR